MASRKRNRRKRRGQYRGDQPTFEGLPSSLVESVIEQKRQPKVDVFAYGPSSYEEATNPASSDITRLLNQYPVVWVNVDSLDDPAIVNQVGDWFGFHRLTLEDVLHVNQRAKVEAYERYYYIVARTAELSDHLITEQLSIFLGGHFIATFQQFPGDSFDSVRSRIREGRGRIRQEAADYLFYHLLDAVIDGYFPILEEFGERLEILEEESFASPSNLTLGRIHNVKRDLLTLRRLSWPLREALNTLLREQADFVRDSTKVYLRDCYDHVVRVIDLVETYRELGSDLSDIYLSSISLRMNEIMKVLTVISTIFIPLTFIVGLYGMNFNTASSPYNMPELTSYYGYPAVLLLMLVVALCMLVFFRRKGWLWGSTPEELNNQSESNSTDGNIAH